MNKRTNEFVWVSRVCSTTRQQSEPGRLRGFFELTGKRRPQARCAMCRAGYVSFGYHGSRAWPRSGDGTSFHHTVVWHRWRTHANRVHARHTRGSSTTICMPFLHPCYSLERAFGQALAWRAACKADKQTGRCPAAVQSCTRPSTPPSAVAPHQPPRLERAPPAAVEAWGCVIRGCGGRRVADHDVC